MKSPWTPENIEESRQIVESARRAAGTRARLRDAVNSLCLAPEKAARAEHTCCLCDQSIRVGDLFRDKGAERKAHSLCVLAVARELK